MTVDTATAGSEGVKKKQEQTFWQRYFTFYDTLNESIPYQRMLASHVSLIATKPGDRVLDAGTGTGNVAAALLAAGARVVGVDFVESALDVCRRKMPGAEFRFADLSKRLEFPDESFDKLTCCNVLYILDPAAQRNAVREFYRVLKPGGTASITVFGAGFATIKIYLDSLREHSKVRSMFSTLSYGLRYSVATARIFYYVSRIKRRQKVGDYTFFTRQQLGDLLELPGFRVEAIEPTFSDQCLIALVRKPSNT
jgi:ubiquinone/menaquinone biosynthesis C-methylase UbiE